MFDTHVDIKYKEDNRKKTAFLQLQLSCYGKERT
jgi:hypothetical protein